MRISDWSSDVCSSDLKKGGDLRLEPDGVDRGSHLASQLQDILETLCGDQPGTRATTLDNSISGHSGAMNEALYRSEEHTSELQSLMRISYAVFCLKKKTNKNTIKTNIIH